VPKRRIPLDWFTRCLRVAIGLDMIFSNGLRKVKEPSGSYILAVGGIDNKAVIILLALPPVTLDPILLPVLLPVKLNPTFNLSVALTSKFIRVLQRLKSVSINIPSCLK